MAEKAPKKLTILLLQILQVETQKRPYNRLVLDGKYFIEKLERICDAENLAIISEFLKFKSIQDFELSYINIPEESYNLLIHSFSGLTSICLTYTNLTSKFLELLFTNCQFLQKLKNLRLNGNPLDEAAANYLQRYLMKSFYIELLDVGYCNLTPATFAMIADGAWKCKTLKTLEMSHHMPQRNMPSIDGQKIGIIIAILVKQTNLTEVHFRNCGLGARDVEPIAEYLRESKNQLKHLDLGSNHIGPGVKCLMEAISENSFSNLVDFDCSRNSLGHLGGEEIARNLYNTNLRYLDISHNEIPAPVMESILKVIDKPKPLHILNIFGNTFDATVARALKRKIDAEILLKDCVDVRVVPEAQNFRVIHQNNLKAPFYRAHESFEIATDKF